MALQPHGLLIVTRLVLAAAITAALPLSHLWWGHSPQSAGIDGPSAFAFILVFCGISAAVGIAFMVLGSFVHLFLRRRPRVVRWIDIGLAVPLVALLVWAGVTATYAWIAD